MFAITFVIAGAALVVIALVISIISLRQRDRRLQARAIKRLGFGVIAVFSLLAGLFIAGEAFEEPGGIGAISLVLAWLIPLVGLAGLAWFRPRLATPIMIALSGVVVLASLWFAVDPDAWRVEDQYGPVRAVAVFVLGAAVGVLGLKRTAIAGWLLVALGVLPIAASSLGSFAGAVSLSVVSVIPLITGILYLVSATLGRRSDLSDPDCISTIVQEDNNRGVSREISSMTAHPVSGRASVPAGRDSVHTRLTRWGVGIAAAVAIAILVSGAIFAVAYAVGGPGATEDNWVGLLGAVSLLGGLVASLAAFALALAAKIKHEQWALLWLPLLLFPALLAFLVLGELFWWE